MNEFEIRRALAGAGAAPATPDPDRLRAALVRADRMKTVRMAVAVGALTLVATVGVFVTRTGEAAGPLDVVNVPETPIPDPLVPVIDEAREEATTTTTPTTTTTAPTTVPVAPDDDPAHLAAPTTTQAPAQITATTTTTTAAPASTTAPPPTTTAASTSTTTTAAPPHTFSAQARYGSCEEDPPYDEYSGTAAAGATITVSSAHNTAVQTIADGNGAWFIRVEFPTAPVDEHFDVTVSDGVDTAVFDFVHTG